MKVWGWEVVMLIKNINHITDKIGGILIVGEVENGQLHPIAEELLHKARELRLDDELIELCIINNKKVDVTRLYQRGMDICHQIISEELTAPMDTLWSDIFLEIIKVRQPKIVLFGATNFGRSIAPRLAAYCKTGLTADCTQLERGDDGDLIQIRPAFSDNLLAHIKTTTSPKMATVRYREFPQAEIISQKTVANVIEVTGNEKLCFLSLPVELVYTMEEDWKSKGAIKEFVIEESPLGKEDICEAQIIVAGGAAIKNQDDWKWLAELASEIGATLGASRALVDQGLASSQMQVGYSGNRVKAKLYIACGISGAPQHLAGMKDSSYIIAINKDPSAPIFQAADLGFVGDMYSLLPELIKAIKEKRNG